MSNHLSMDKSQAIQQLHHAGLSQREISKLLGIDRKSVRRHLKAASSKGTTSDQQAPTAGGSGTAPSKGTIAPTAPEDATTTEAPVAPGPRSRSECEPYRDVIVAALGQDLTAQRIYQDLIVDHDYKGSYWSVNRFVKQLQVSKTLPFRRMETCAGHEAQVDFGMGAPYLDSQGKKRRCYVLRVVLSHSRKGYSEVVERQTTECFIRALENAFHAFGGVPRTLVIDNLRAAVTKADWYDPELNRKILEFCRHYNVVVLPTKPRMPRHKGKVERGVAYVQDNALKGRVFESLNKQNEFLAHWERTVADTRMHGTIKCHVGALFMSSERSQLRPLPPQRFPFFHEATRRVSRDGHVEVAKSYYSAPPEYVGSEVWARWDQHLVRIYNQKWEKIAVHARVEAGKFSTHPGHISSKKTSILEQGMTYLLHKVRLIGPHAARWAETMLAERGIAGTRVLQGLLTFTDKYTTNEIEAACDAAWRQQSLRLRAIRQLLAHPGPTQSTMEFVDEHPLIRSPSEYAAFVKGLFQ